MKIKDGVTIAGLNIKMRIVLIMADLIWEELGQELVITSGLEGTHSAGSLHYYGYAVDFRTFYFTEEEKKKAIEDLRDNLGLEYDVVWHNSHVHVEYNKVI